MSSSKTRDLPAEETTKSLSLENNGYDKEVISHDMCNEMTDAQREAIVYRSKLLNKYFESYDDMLKEEAEFKRQNDEKKALVEAKKARAKEIEEAKKHLLEVRKQAREMIKEADDKYNELVNKFVSDYGSYHESTFEKDGKSTVTVSDLLDSFFGPFIGL